MSALNRGCKNGLPENSVMSNIRTRICHFLPIAITRDSDEKHGFKIGDTPTINLNYFSIENEECNENKNLDRIVGSPGDMQKVCNNETKNKTN